MLWAGIHLKLWELVSKLLHLTGVLLVIGVMNLRVL